MLLFLLSVAEAEDLIFFADDHYKAVGLPVLNASVPNPVLPRGQAAFEVVLANSGRLEELMPISGNGSQQDIQREMEEEMHSVDALSIEATLEGSGQVRVASGPVHIERLASGSLAVADFNLSVGSGEGSWIELPLHLSYERQADVSVSDGSVSPLYEPENITLMLRVLAPVTSTMAVLATKSGLSPGGSGEILIFLENRGLEDQHNCTARLAAQAPFHVLKGESSLGDLPAGAVATAVFSLSVDETASLQEYQMSCEVLADEGRIMLSFPLDLAPGGGPLQWILIPGLVVVMLAAGAIGIAQSRHIRFRRGWRR